ncbi:DUF2062 domain-containing protein [Salinibaculum rarum]|uniref:DUF2062 domain-containing protein n=1 Tax=Salinibaculum rarum TaxID=3058903 RepID=UPI00265D9361|nr:DUF2062 domain-containing protein [Salinibaculum sp. KK48]
MGIDPRGRFRRTVRQATQLLRHAFAERHSTERVARTFSLGLFVAMLPTVGVGPTLLLAVSGVVERINRLAVVAAVLVCNPLVKPAVYVAGLALGFVLLGPVEGVALTDASLTAAPDVFVRLLVGNLVLAVLVAIPGYLVAFRALDHYRRRKSAVGSVTE